jgi:hypothetical protein
MPSNSRYFAPLHTVIVSVVHLPGGTAITSLHRSPVDHRRRFAVAPLKRHYITLFPVIILAIAKPGLSPGFVFFAR